MCYLIADLEDAFNNGIVSYADAKKFLSAFWRDDDRVAEINVRLEDLETREAWRSAVNFMRATAIGKGIRAAGTAFEEHESAILAGTAEQGLFKMSSLKNEIAELRDFSLKQIYSVRAVESVELMGFQVMQSLADFFLDWIQNPDCTKGRKIASVFNLKNAGTTESRVREVVDYIAGMTDSFALATYRKINGIAD